MSKRNFILLVIVLCIVAIIALVSLYFLRPAGTGEDVESTNFFSNLNPFRSTPPATPATTEPTPSPTPGNAPESETPSAVKLQKVSSMPVAGFVVFQKERYKEVAATTLLDTTTSEVPATTPAKKTAKPTPPATEFVPAIRYVDRATGNIYQTFADKLAERKFSTTVIPKIYEAYFSNKGNTVVMRYLKTDNKTIETFVGTMPKDVLGGDTTGETEVKGTFLPVNITDVSMSADASKLFYLFNTGASAESGDSVVGITMDLLNNKKVQIFENAFTEWLSDWPNSKMITLTNKPSALAPGYMYALNVENKSFSKILGEINGLTTLTSPSGKLVLYTNNNLTLAIYHTDTKSSDQLSIRTLPEKCVWGAVSDVIYCAVPRITPGNQYPDSWYQGEVSFSDQIWKIDVDTGNASMILDPSIALGGEDVDATKLSLDEGENYLFFVNKKDSFLWKLDLI